MSQVQRILANESGPWSSTQGSSKAMSFTINVPAAVDFDRSYLVLRTTIAIGAHPAKADTRRQIGLGFMQQAAGGGLMFPIPYKTSSFLRDVNFTTETKGSLMATQYANIASNSLNLFTASEGDLRTKAAYGEGWSELEAYFGTNGVSNAGVYGTGFYASPFLTAVRDGATIANISQYEQYLDLIVPCSDVMGSLGKQVLPMDRLGRSQLTFATESNVQLVSAYIRSAASNWPAIAYVRVNAGSIRVTNVRVRDLQTDCPFYIGQSFTTDGAVDFTITSITISGAGVVGAIQLGTDVDTTADGTMTELAQDADEVVTWSISQASLVMLTVPSVKIPRQMMMEYVSLVDVPWGPSATQLIGQMISLPVGTVACFLANPYDVPSTTNLLVSITDPFTHVRFSLDNVDLTNRDLVPVYPPNSVYMDRLAAMLNANTDRLKSLLYSNFSSLPSAAWSGPANTTSQMQITIQCSRAYDSSVLHLFCVVVRSLMM